MRIDSINGVTGIYVSEIFLNCLGMRTSTDGAYVVHTIPLLDFGGLPDPTSWKYFGNLLHIVQLYIYVVKKVLVSAQNIREKDGI